MSLVKPGQFSSEVNWYHSLVGTSTVLEQVKTGALFLVIHWCNFGLNVLIGVYACIAVYECVILNVCMHVLVKMVIPHAVNIIIKST